MKIVRINDKEINVIVESDKYIDIYTYRDYTDVFKREADDPDLIWLDNGKGWRIIELNRLDRETGEIYEVSANPHLTNFDGFYDYSIKLKKDDSVYTRTLSMNFRDEFDYFGYVNQDLCGMVKTVPLTEEIKKQFNISEGTTLWSSGSDKINVKNNTYKISKYMDQMNLDDDPIFESMQEMMNYYYKLEERKKTVGILDDYISNPEYDFVNTNSLFRAFRDFSRKYYVFGRKGEEPRLLEIIGQNEQTFNIQHCTPISDARVKCLKPNKYKKVDDIQRWSIID